MKKYLIITILFLIIILLVVNIPGLDGSYVKNSKLYINEILPSNQYTLKDNNGESSDYIELYNNYNYDINLSGYYLSDSEYETKKWTFPDITIKSKSYLIIYASGKDKVDLTKQIVHTNFKLSSTGEVLTLTEPEGNIISKITYPEILPDIAYGYSNGKYFLMEPTPGEENTTKEYRQENIDLTNKIIINEYMTDNQRYNYDQTGNYYDWVELYNQQEYDIILKDVYLSDNIQQLNKFKLPEITIKSNSYLIIYLSEETNKDSNDIHANFKLSAKEDLILSDGKNIYDKLLAVSLPENVSYGLKDNKWYYFSSPTPGSINNTYALENIRGDNNGNN